MDVVYYMYRYLPKFVGATNVTFMTDSYQLQPMFGCVVVRCLFRFSVRP